VSDSHRNWQEERRLRREDERARLRRQRWIVGIVAAIVLAGAGVATTLALNGSDSGHDGQAGRSSTRESTSSTKHSTTKSTKTRTTPVTTGRHRTTHTTTGTKRTTTRSASPLYSLRGKTIAIDPGHNGGNSQHTTEINKLVNAGTVMKACDTTGTSTNSGYSESAYNLDVALRLSAILKRAGARVVLTRSTDTGWGPCITERAAIGNDAHAAAAISIHADGGPATGHGFHVIYPASVANLTDDIASASYQLALAIRTAFHAGTDMPYANYIGQGGLDERNDLGGLNLSDVPKVFIETVNMRNAGDAALFGSSSFREREAQALAKGLAAFLRA